MDNCEGAPRQSEKFSDLTVTIKRPSCRPSYKAGTKRILMKPTLVGVDTTSRPTLKIFPMRCQIFASAQLLKGVPSSPNSARGQHLAHATQSPCLNNRDSVARKERSQVYAGQVDNSSLLATAQAREQSRIRMANTRKELLIGGKWLATRTTTGTNTYLARQSRRNLQMPSSRRGYQPKGEDKTFRTTPVGD